MAYTRTVNAYSNNPTTKTAITTNQVIALTDIGSVPSTISTVSCLEYSTGMDVVTVLKLTDFVVGTPTAGASLGFGNIIYSYPAGQHFELVYAFDAISLTLGGDATNVDLGLGSVVASGAVSVLSGTATFESRLTGQTVATASGGGAAVSNVLAATAGIGTGISLNTASAVKDVFLNGAAAWAANASGTLKANGHIILKWTNMNV